MLFNFSKRKILQLKSLQKWHHRDYKQDLYWYLVMWYNRYSERKVRKLGPERACAEWLLRCAADIRLKGTVDMITSVRQCRSIDVKQEFIIEEIDASHSCLHLKGFEYFAGLKGVKTVKLKYCNWIDDLCMIKLVKHLGASLQHLEIVSVGTITWSGLLYLQNAKALKFLYLHDLPLCIGRPLDLAMDTLRMTIGRHCKIIYPMRAEEAKRKGEVW